MFDRNEIPPSPEAYSAPSIIPSSPTDDSDAPYREDTIVRHRHASGDSSGGRQRHVSKSSSSGSSFDLLANSTLATDSQMKENDRTLINCPAANALEVDEEPVEASGIQVASSVSSQVIQYVNVEHGSDHVCYD